MDFFQAYVSPRIYFSDISDQSGPSGQQFQWGENFSYMKYSTGSVFSKLQFACYLMKNGKTWPENEIFFFSFFD